MIALKPKSALHDRWKGLSSCGPTVNSFEYRSLHQNMRTLKSAHIDCHFVLQKKPSITRLPKLQNIFLFCFLTCLTSLGVSDVQQNHETLSRPASRQVEKQNGSTMQTSSSGPASLHGTVLFDWLVSNRIKPFICSGHLSVLAIKLYNPVKLLCAVLPLQILVRAPYRCHNIFQP